MKYLYLTSILFLFFSCKSRDNNIQIEKELSTVQELADHSAEFDKPEVIEVTEGVHVAVGFGLANSILVEGENGNIIIDCLESNGTARNVKAAFEKINNKPTSAIIYTHNHADHIFGAEIMAGDNNPEIYSHDLTNYYIDRLINIVRPVIEKRSYRMFGTVLGDAHVNCGIGPILDADENTERSIMRPTVTFADELKVEIEGIQFEMYHAPGETDDQIFVWLPEKKVLLPGDNIYRTFPNLYTIRGTPYRDVKTWAVSLDRMRALEPDYLVPSHTRPLSDKEEITNVLRDYADGIRYVHDRTIFYMNQGLSPDEIAERVILPAHLSKSPFLKEFYGRVDWSVKNIFNGYLGWFDGNPSTLLPLPVVEHAKKMVDLAGGEAEMKEEINESIDNKEYQWALELTDYLLRINPDDQQVLDLRFECLTALGEAQSNPNARNYFLTTALESKGKQLPVVSTEQPALLKNIPVAAIFGAMSVNLDAEKCMDFEKTAVFNFTDSNSSWVVQIRNGIVQTFEGTYEAPDLTIETTEQVWKELAAKVRKPATTLLKGDLKVEGGVLAFREFMDKFIQP